ncbi:MAG: NAD(P)/FAD-dependent oxidoreductase [Synergistaceae bacterium]|nr:NAD(P)/FAD-dependent oxidoreductase [Synergistaceae bacterium]
MNKEYDAIVVGGGLAGLTSAAYLCRYGYRTLLLEKSHKTGGLVNTFWHQGYAFDAGIRAFENSGILFPMLKSLGLELEFAPNPVSIGIGDRWTRLCGQESLKSYAKMLTKIFPENAPDIDKITLEIQKVMDYMDVLYGIDNLLFLDNMKDPKLLKTLLPWLLKYPVNIRKASRLSQPVVAYLKRFTSNQHLIDMITQHFFKDTPTFFALSYFGLYLDYRYPKGGTGVLAEAVTDFIMRSGGEFLTDTTVTRVDTNNKQLYTAGGESYNYKKLVWAADQKTFYAAVDAHTPQAGIQRALVDKGSGGDSILSVFMGVNLDREYFADRCGSHAFYTPSTVGLTSLTGWTDATATEDKLNEWIGQYLECTTYEISCPALRDAALAPQGKTGVIVSTLMDYRLVKHISNAGKYGQFKEYCMGKIAEVLESSVFPGILEKVEFALCSTPITIERETGNSHGAITGWAFTNEKMPSESRFRRIAESIDTPIEDVYQCGQWTFSPSGLPVSILTGKLAADAIHKKMKGSGS